MGVDPHHLMMVGTLCATYLEMGGAKVFKSKGGPCNCSGVKYGPRQGNITLK